MPIRSVSAPADSVYRIGRAPDPLAFPPPSLRPGTGRFDDAEGRFNVLYAGERRACFVETLARFRLPLDLLVAADAIEPADRGTDLPPLGIVPPNWLASRRIATFRPEAPGRSWLDVRAPETHESLRRELATELRTRGYEAYALGDALGRDRALTQAIARWAHRHGFAGIVYPSRFDPILTCWAIFESVPLSVHAIDEIAVDDPDLVAVAALFDLTLAVS